MYDNICKFIAENFSDDLASWLLGTPVKLTKLNPRELSLEPIRMDSLILQQSEELVLHTEFQTEPDPTIPFRMLDYRVRGYRCFPDKEMRQIVVYLRPTNSELVRQTSFRLSRTHHEFDVIRLWEQPTEIFLSAPGLLPFAVLSRTPEPELVLNQVARSIDQITDRNVQSNICASTAILAGLRLNGEVITRLLRREIMRESVIYQEILHEGLQGGVEQGIEIGKQQGIEIGKQQGIEIGKQQGLQQLQEAKEGIAINLLKTGMTVEQVVTFTGLSVEQVQHLQQ